MGIVIAHCSLGTKPMALRHEGMPSDPRSKPTSTACVAPGREAYLDRCVWEVGPIKRKQAQLAPKKDIWRNPFVSHRTEALFLSTENSFWFSYLYMSIDGIQKYRHAIDIGFYLPVRQDNLLPNTSS